MTIQEIAKIAGVSPSAVSFVLNDRPGVSHKKRQKIKALLLENGYTLKTAPPDAKQTSNISSAKHIKFVKLRNRYQNDDFATCILDAVEQSAKEYGFHLSITNIDHEDCREIFSQLSHESVDGIIFLSSSFTEDLWKTTSALSIPCVYVDYGYTYHMLNTVNADSDQGMYLIVKHLTDLGHQKIGYLRSKQQIGCLHRRFSYFQQHLSELCPQKTPDCVIEVDMQSNNLEQYLSQVFSSLDHLPTALVADNDTIAASCIYTFQKMGIKIPDDISIVGFDNAQISSLVFPRLSTIDINFNELGRVAVERLQALISNPHRTASHTDVSVNFVNRESTAKPKHKDSFLESGTQI